MTIWTTERIAELTLRWLTQSARIIAKDFGVTRNAVIGKANRLKLSHNERSEELPQIKRPRKPPAPDKEKFVLDTPDNIPIAPTTPPEPVAFMKLKSHHCRAIVGTDENNFATYCGHPKWGGTSYCNDHAAKYYVWPRRR